MNIPEKKQDLISLLNSLGFNIAVINEEYFVFKIFECQGTELYLKAQNITKFMDGNFIIQRDFNDLQQKTEIYNKIEQVPLIIRKYSSSFPYILFLSR